MPETSSYEPGTPSWVDLGTPDIPGAIRFYNSVFGWDAEDTGPDGGGYQMLRKDGKYVAGLGPATNPGPPYWTTYVSVADLDDAVNRIEKEGGNILMPPVDVLDAGRMAIAVDPTGAAFATWQPGAHIGAGLIDEPGSLCWTELNTRDTSTAASFYTAVFGWGTKTSSHDGGSEASGGGGMTYTEFQVGDRSVAGMMAMAPDMPADVPSHWLVYFAVEDCDAAVERIKAAGGGEVTPTMDIDVGRFAVVHDPKGAVFAVIKLAS